MAAHETPHQAATSPEESSQALFHNSRRCCSFLPCFERPSGGGVPWWQRIRAAEIETSGSLWSRGVAAVMKIREWSEIVAGPRWKTFIRRFNRNRNNSNKHVNFQYDPLSYAMNFDEGPGQGQGQSSHFTNNGENDDEYYYGSRNFSSRYAKGSMDLGKDGTNFV